MKAIVPIVGGAALVGLGYWAWSSHAKAQAQAQAAAVRAAFTVPTGGLVTPALRPSTTHLMNDAAWQHAPIKAPTQQASAAVSARYAVHGLGRLSGGLVPFRTHPDMIPSAVSAALHAGAGYFAYTHHWPKLGVALFLFAGVNAIQTARAMTA